jgi:hypothetical protein
MGRLPHRRQSQVVSFAAETALCHDQTIRKTRTECRFDTARHANRRFANTEHDDMAIVVQFKASIFNADDIAINRNRFPDERSGIKRSQNRLEDHLSVGARPFKLNSVPLPPFPIEAR